MSRGSACLPHSLAPWDITTPMSSRKYGNGCRLKSARHAKEDMKFILKIHLLSVGWGIEGGLMHSRSSYRGFECVFMLGLAMTQAVSRRPFTEEARVCARFSPYEICDGQSGTGTVFFPEFFGFPLSASFRRGSPYSYIIWGINNRPVGGRSSES
jgi:hypothetical protein